MRVVVIYESLTGNTRRAADVIAGDLIAAGHPTTVCPVTDVDHQALSEADLVVIGTWTDGIFVVGQRPGRAGRLRSMPAIAGKKAVVYVTFALNPGKTLDKAMAIVAGRGADVIGGMTIRRNDLTGGAHDFAERLLAAVAA